MLTPLDCMKKEKSGLAFANAAVLCSALSAMGGIPAAPCASYLFDARARGLRAALPFWLGLLCASAALLLFIRVATHAAREPRQHDLAYGSHPSARVEDA